MDLNIYWSPGSNANIADGFNVFYKEYDPLGLNTWILANPTLLPYTATSYTITGLDANTVYRVMVAKSCLGIQDVVIESTVVNSGCPVVATWQGPVVNNYPTLFYSVYYPDGHHMGNARVALYDTEVSDALPTSCPTPANLVVGRTAYITANFCLNFTSLYCAEQQLDFLSPSNASSAVSYLGRDTRNVFPGNSLLGTCDNGLPTVGGALAPLLLKYNNDYKFNITPQIKYASEFFYQDTTCFWYTVDVTPFSFPTNPAATYPTLNVANAANISAAICFDSVTGNVDYTLADGLGRTNINDYTFSFTTSDGVTSIPLVNSSGVPITSYNGTYNIYAPVKVQTYAPGGGNSAGYTITNAIVSGGNTTYTYTGGINAFTVGQEVFVNSINPSSFQFPTTSKTITAATSNSFTVSFTPAGTYQTGGIATGYTELTDGMTITVDLLPGPDNVITLTNQNYAGLTLKQALDNIANSINTTTSYTASAVVIAGLPYLKIDAPGTTYTSATVLFEGPNILTKGAPDYPQISQNGVAAYATSSSVSYNGFLYASYYTSSTAEIIATDTSLVDPPTSYGHDIDIPIWTMALVEETPPAAVYTLDHVANGGDYSLNIAVDSLGYTYIANDTTVSIYNGTIFVDSQDLSALAGGPTTPIRLLEFNTTDNLLYVFVDGNSNNFYIVDASSWSIITPGTYTQTNYVTTNAITAWNNLTSGPTAARGTVTGTLGIPAPIIPIPCVGANSIPCLPVPNINWEFGANDGTNSALFQDTTKSWTATPQLYSQTEYNIYNYVNENLGYLVKYTGSTYFPSYGLNGDTVSVSAGISLTGAKTTFTIANGNGYGIFSKNKIVDYTANFNSRTWSNLSRYLITSTSGRNNGANGFLNTASPLYHTATTFNVDSYGRNIRPKDKQINAGIGLDGTSTYMLFDITDGGTCYNSTSNLVYISSDGGSVQTIDNTGTVTPHQLYKTFPTNDIAFTGPVQMVADPNSNLVYAISRDARSTVDDMNIYVLDNTGQIDLIDGSALWNTNICGQISIDPVTGILYFTGKNTRNFYEYDPATGLWDNKIVPSVYEKFNGFTYGDGSVIERIQGATYLSSGKFVVMNYLQQTFSTELKYTYDVSNIFVYDYTTNTIEQVLVGTGVSAYSGAAVSYNPNYYGEFFGINDYNADYCYGGLSIKVDSTGKIFWKKSISDQVYTSQVYAENGVAQIWGTASAGNSVASNLIRIWNIQSDGSLVQSKRTILDNYSTFSYITYDSHYNRLITVPLTQSNVSAQFYAINTQNLTGAYGVNDNGTTSKYNVAGNIGGLAVSTFLSGKQTTVYAVSVTPTEITYSVRPTGANAIYNGIFPHHYAVGEVVKITGVVSSPAGELNFPNPDASAGIITAITPTSFTIANVAGTSATYTSGGTVIDAVWASTYTASNFGSVSTDNKGNIIVVGNGSGDGQTGYNNAGTTFILKYEANDLFTQRENPKVFAPGIVSSPCVATPDGLFRGLSSPGVGRAHGQLNNAFLLHVPSQNTYWIMGSKNPSCSISGVTSITYDAIAQTIRYYIPNSFTVGKVVTISGIVPSAYNLSRVPITAVDPTWIEVSYTGSAPAAYTSGGTIGLSSNFVIKVLDDTTLATVATISLTSINDLLDLWVQPDNYVGRFQYSEDTEEIYLYSAYTSEPVYVFSTITNTLVRSSSFNRMVLPYTALNRAFTLENVNGVPYFSAYASLAPTPPTRFWFRLDVGSRSFSGNVHNELNVSITDYSTSTTVDNYDLYSLSNMSDTFGQWKEITDTTWATIPNTISTTLGATIEFTSFILDKPLVAIRNLTQGTTYSISNGLNAIKVYTILVDSINLFNGDLLEFEFTNPDNPSCPFINQSTITF